MVIPLFVFTILIFLKIDLELLLHFVGRFLRFSSSSSEISIEVDFHRETENEREDCLECRMCNRYTLIISNQPLN